MEFYFSVLVCFSLLSPCTHSSNDGICSDFPLLGAMLPMSCRTLQSSKCAPVILHDHSQSGATSGTLSVQLTGSISLHTSGIAQGLLGVLG